MNLHHDQAGYHWPEGGRHRSHDSQLCWPRQVERLRTMTGLLRKCSCSAISAGRGKSASASTRGSRTHRMWSRLVVSPYGASRRPGSGEVKAGFPGQFHALSMLFLSTPSSGRARFRGISRRAAALGDFRFITPCSSACVAEVKRWRRGVTDFAREESGQCEPGPLSSGSQNHHEQRVRELPRR